MADLELELRALGAELAVPAGEGLVARVRERVAAGPAPSRPWWSRVLPSPRPVRRAVVVAIVLVLVVATVVGAAALGLPGLRIIFGPEATPTSSAGQVPSPTTEASPGEPSAGSTDPGLGSGLGLGPPLPIDDLDATVPFEVLQPTDPRLSGPAVARWEPDLGDGQLTLLWPASAELGETLAPGVGLLLTQTPGGTDAELIEKSIRPRGAAEPVTVDGAPGFWLSGPPHEFIWWQATDGTYVEDSRRTVGDTLVWSAEGMLYRLETALSRDAAIEIAESLE
jgi:hypothetical protein